MTGNQVSEAATPGRWAAPPAPAMMTSMPRSVAVSQYSASCDGVRCALMTRISYGTPSSSSIVAAWDIAGVQSDLLPMMIPTSGRTSMSDSLTCAGAGPRSSYIRLE